MHAHIFHGCKMVFVGVIALGAAAVGQLVANNEQTVLTVIGEIITASITGYCVVKVAQLKTHINSRMDQLIELTRVSSKAEGVIEGRAQQKQEHKNENKN